MNIKLRILNDLQTGIIPSYNRYIIQKSYFTDLLDELKESNYLVYGTIHDQNSPFFGEPTEIRLTEEGEKYINAKNS